MWVQTSADGCDGIVLGATTFGLYLAGEVVAFMAKPRGAHVERGRGMGTVECHKTVLSVRAPLSLILEDSNEAAEQRPSLINASPYGNGWLARGKPLAWSDERGLLCDASTYRRHILSIDPGACFDE